MKRDGGDEAQAEQGQAERPRLGREMDHAVEQRQDGDRDQAEADERRAAPRAADRRAAGRADRQVAACQRHRDQAERRDDKKIERQPNHSTSTPPTLGPTAAQGPCRSRRSHRLAALAVAEGVQDDDRRDRLQHAGGEALGDAHRQDELERGLKPPTMPPAISSATAPV